MNRSDKLTIAQGILVSLQCINAGLATVHASAVLALGIGAVLAGGSYIIHQMTMNTKPPNGEGKA